MLKFKLVRLSEGNVGAAAPQFVSVDSTEHHRKIQTNAAAAGRPGLLPRG